MVKEGEIEINKNTLIIAIIIIVLIIINPFDFGNNENYKSCVKGCAYDAERCIMDVGTLEEKYTNNCIDRDDSISCANEIEYCINRCG